MMKQPYEGPNNPTDRIHQVEDPKDSRNYRRFDYPKTTNLKDIPEEDSLEASLEAEDFRGEDTDTPEEEDIPEEEARQAEDHQEEDGDHPHSPYHKQITGRW